jgi:hypothetical protein
MPIKGATQETDLPASSTEATTAPAEKTEFNVKLESVSADGKVKLKSKI